MSSDEERFDGMLFTLAQQHPNGILDLLDTLFSFLARKTDFYTGGPKGSAHDILLEKFRKYEKVAKEKANKEAAEREEIDRVRREKIKKQKEEEDASRIVEVDDAEAARIVAENEKKKQTAAAAADSAAHEAAVKPEQAVVEQKVLFYS